jgi:hypothetical protein
VKIFQLSRGKGLSFNMLIFQVCERVKSVELKFRVLVQAVFLCWIHDSFFIQHKRKLPTNPTHWQLSVYSVRELLCVRRKFSLSDWQDFCTLEKSEIRRKKCVWRHVLITRFACHILPSTLHPSPLYIIISLGTFYTTWNISIMRVQSSAVIWLLLLNLGTAIFCLTYLFFVKKR